MRNIFHFVRSPHDVTMSIPARLKEERERLGLSQSAFGQLGAVGRSTVINWEQGSSFPNAEFLEAAAKAGADVLYIVTGQRQVKLQSQVQQQASSAPLPDPVNPEWMERVYKMLDEVAKQHGKTMTEHDKIHAAAAVYNFIIQDQGAVSAVKEDRLERVTRLVVNN